MRLLFVVACRIKLDCRHEDRVAAWWHQMLSNEVWHTAYGWLPGLSHWYVCFMGCLHSSGQSAYWTRFSVQQQPQYATTMGQHGSCCWAGSTTQVSTYYRLPQAHLPTMVIAVGRGVVQE